MLYCSEKVTFASLQGEIMSMSQFHVVYERHT